MDLMPNPSFESFRAEVRAFLAEALTPELREAGKRTGGVFTDWTVGKSWHKALHDKGWIAPAWPVEHGGTGWDEMQRYIFSSECAAAGAPLLPAFGLRMIGPVLMRFGRPDQQAFYLPRILSGEDFWCQGYSEPGSGSDLASLQCKAVRQGDHYVVNGTKIWTTFAHFANRIFCLVRTDNSGRPQEGITFLLIDMDTPGVRVRPIITMAGDHEVNQVFFDDVRVPVSHRVGEEGQGWAVAKYLLEFERGNAYAAALRVALAGVRRHAPDDPAFRAKLAETEVELAALEFTEHRIMSALANGQNPGPASSLLKCRGTEMSQRVTELALEAAAAYAAPDQKDARLPGANVAPIGPDWAVTASPKYLNTRASSIYGGSNEVQRNIMAKLVLGL